MIPRIVHVRDNVEGAVYIGRKQNRLRMAQSPFANPFTIGRDGTRTEVVEMFADFLTTPIGLSVVAKLPLIRTAPALACWCRHDGEALTGKTICHGDVLRLLLDTLSNVDILSIAMGRTPLTYAVHVVPHIIRRTEEMDGKSRG